MFGGLQTTVISEDELLLQFIHSKDVPTPKKNNGTSQTPKSACSNTKNLPPNTLSELRFEKYQSL